ncbi:hypothetical protein JW968_07280 [Candidatus Woesearchaeota archaeon]|nr:hypothetical protein [Candidatus Woesearchaeota archaeon]
MGEVSNKTLVYLLVAAIVVSLASFAWLMGGISELGMLAGFATGETNYTGKVNITITQVLSINATDLLIDFGVNSNFSRVINNITCDSATGTQVVDAVTTDANGFNGPGCLSGDHFALWNDGNVEVNISINVTGTAAELVCQDATSGNYTFCTAQAALEFKLDGHNCASGITTYQEFPKNVENVSWCNALPIGSTPQKWANVSAKVLVPLGASTLGNEASVNVIFEAVKK